MNIHEYQAKSVLREFSTRRREIEAHLDEHSQHSAKAAQVATYATRRPKHGDADPAGLVPAWRERAAAVGLTPETLAAVLDRDPSIEPPRVGSAEAEELYRWLASPEGLTASVSTLGQRDVIRGLLGLRELLIAHAADGLVERPGEPLLYLGRVRELEIRRERSVRRGEHREPHRHRLADENVHAELRRRGGRVV